MYKCFIFSIPSIYVYTLWVPCVYTCLDLSTNVLHTDGSVISKFSTYYILCINVLHLVIFMDLHGS